MKRIISLVLGIVMLLSLSMTAFAAEITGDSGSVDITYTYEAPADSYIVTIPDSMTIGADADVSVSEVTLTAGYLLTVSVSSQQYSEGWKLVNGDDALGYTLKIDDADIENNATVLTAKNGDSEVTKTLVTALSGTPKYSGNYTDTLTFHVSVAECEHEYENSTCKYCGMLTHTYDDTTNTYTVYTAEGLLAWNTAAQADLSTNLVLAADITLTGENNWTPLGYEEYYGAYYYTGTIDGAGHTVSGLHISDDSLYAAFVRLLGPDGAVKNLTFENVTIESKGFCAVVVADNYGLVENCHVTSGTVTATSTESAGAAGIVYVNGATGIVSGCSNAADVTSHSYNGVGGIVNSNSGLVMGCVNSGAVTLARTEGGSNICGGVVGNNDNTLVACYNIGEVTGGNNTGGVTGYNYNSAIGSWTKATSEVYGTEVSEHDGIGRAGGTQNACYSFADASAVTTDIITEMNTAIESYNGTAAEGKTCPYTWQAGDDGYPILVKETE